MKLPATMKGVMFVERGKAVIEREPTPTLEPGTLLCRTIYSGLTNGTERNFLCGGNYGGYHWPNRLGYQNVGEILEVGEGVDGYTAGEVIFSGEICNHVEYFAMPAGPESLVVKLPKTIDPRHAALFGLAGVAMHDVQRARVALGERVLVVGAGLIGQFTAQCARLAGGEVTVIDLDEDRLKTAKALGAAATVRITGDESWASAGAAGRFDVVFEDSGAPVLDRIVGLGWGDGMIKNRGRLVMIAGRDRVDYSFNAGQARELTVLHAGHFTAADLRLVCKLAAEGALRCAPLIKDVVKIDDCAAVYDRLRDEPATLFGTVFDWQ